MFMVAVSEELSPPELTLIRLESRESAQCRALSRLRCVPDSQMDMPAGYG